jgi:hypothetical protein
LRIALSGVPEDAVVEIRCHGRGCRVARRAVTIRKGRGDAASALHGSRMRVGARVDVRITAPGSVGEVVRYRMRRGRIGPARSNLCLRVGAETPTAC